MRRRTSRTREPGFAALLVLAVIGCRTSDAERLPSIPEPTTPLESLAHALIEAQCAIYASGCGDFGTYSLDRFVSENLLRGVSCERTVFHSWLDVATRDDASSFFNDPLRFPYPTLESDRDLARIGRYLVEQVMYVDGVSGEWDVDSPHAAVCVADLGARCASIADLRAIPSCRAWLSGDVPLGGTCAFDSDCGPGAFCGPSVADEGTCTTSVCSRRSAIGDPCVPLEDSCDAGDAIGTARCGTHSEDSFCEFVGLTPPALVDEPCESERNCSPGLYCRLHEGTRPDVCRPQLRVGDECDEASRCEFGARCHYFDTREASYCVSNGEDRLAEGELCGGLARLLGDVCDPYRGLYCPEGDDARCARVGDGRIGATCRRAYSDLDCDAGLRCAGRPGGFERCTPIDPSAVELQPDRCDEWASWLNTCPPGSACLGFPRLGACVALPLVEGEVCITPDGARLACAPGLECLFYVDLGSDWTPLSTFRCHAFDPTVECRDDDDCESGRICRPSESDSSGPSFCISEGAPIGSPCSGDEGCASHRCEYATGASETTCAPIGGDGRFCYEDAQCASGLCSRLDLYAPGRCGEWSETCLHAVWNR